MEKELQLFGKLDDLCLETIYNNLDCRSYKIMTGKDRVNECVQYYDAVENGHLKCLQYLHKNGRFWDKYICKHAAKRGYLDCLAYAHENGCPWDTRTCI